MNRLSSTVFAVSVFALWGTPQATAHTISPAPPASPAAPRVPGQGAVSIAASVDKIVSDALATVNQADKKIQEGINRSIVLNSRALNGLPEKRQDIDLVDVPLKEALKRVLDESKTPYVIDDDVPNEPKISIKLANAPLTTILDALTLSNGIGWRTEFKRSPAIMETTKESEKEKENKQAQSDSYFNLFAGGASSTRYTTQIHVGKKVAAVPHAFQVRTMDIEGPPAIAPPNALRGAAGPQGSQMITYRWQSQKRTFTCPRCHNSISILHQPEDVKCTKCQRSFEDSWKVCPFDGTKRPESKNKWRYCPICGKSITMEASWSAPLPFSGYSGFMGYHSLDFPASFYGEYVPLGLSRYFPVLQEDDEAGHAHWPMPTESISYLILPEESADPEFFPVP